MLHENLIALCFIEAELRPIEVVHRGNAFSTFFAPVTLTLTFTGWPSYTNLICIPWIEDIPDMWKWTFYVKSSLYTACECVHYSYSWSLPVTWQRRRSHDPPQSKTPMMLYANLMALSVTGPELWEIEVLHCGNRNLFGSVYVTWWPSYTTFPVLPGDTWDVQIWTSYVRAFERQTLWIDTTEIIYHAGGQKSEQKDNCTS